MLRINTQSFFENSILSTKASSKKVAGLSKKIDFPIIRLFHNWMIHAAKHLEPPPPDQ